MLTVKKTQRAPSTEHSFENAFAKALLACGRKSWHPLYREKGWPDRYVHHGIWIELKSLTCVTTRNELEPEQKARLNDLQEGGERTFYCAVVHERDKRTVIFKPWPLIRACKDLREVERYAYVNKTDLEEMIRHELG